MPQIRINEKLHKQVKKIADANFRGMADQVAYWAANDCPHPTEMREEMEIVVAVPDKDGKVGESQSLRIFYCKQCRKVVLNGAESELAERVRERIQK